MITVIGFPDDLFGPVAEQADGAGIPRQDAAIGRLLMMAHPRTPRPPPTGRVIFSADLRLCSSRSSACAFCCSWEMCFRRSRPGKVT